MGEFYKLKNSGGSAILSLLFRMVRMVFILSVLGLLLFYIFKAFTFTNFLIAETVVVVVSLIYALTLREAEEISIEGNKVVLKGRRFIFFKYTATADTSKVRYKFNKPADKKKKLALVPSRDRLELYKSKRKWADFTTGIFGWGRGELADIVKSLIARGCYNWFDFHRKR